MNNLSFLNEFGLSDIQIRIYDYLLTNRFGSIEQIKNILLYSYAVVRDNLRHLERKGFITSSDGKPKMYFRSNPKIALTEILKNRRNPVYGAIDVSLGKKSKSGDYSCIVTIVRDLKTGLLLVKDIDIKRRSVDEQIDSILKAHKRHKYKLFAVETNAFQYVVAENLRKESRKEGIYVPIKEINNYQDKKMRIEGIVPFALDGTIIFDSQAVRYKKMYALAVEQISTFTGENDRHDDAPDSLEMAVRISTQKLFKRRYKENK